MTGEPRYREADFRYTNIGSFSYFWPMTGTWYNTANQGQKDRCEDVIGNYHSNNPFDKISQTCYTALLDGELWVSGKKARGFYACPLTKVSVAKDSRAVWPEPNVISLAQRAIAASNPSKPHISLPIAIAELKDVPDLVEALGIGWLLGLARSRAAQKHLLGRRYGTWRRKTPLRELRLKLIGDKKPLRRDLWNASHQEAIFAGLPESPTITSAVKAIASGNLTWRFGIAPVISDIRSLLSFQEAVFKRFQYLERLRKYGWVRRRVGLGYDQRQTVDTGVPVLMQSQGAIVYAKEHVEYTLDTWATVKWQASWEGVGPKLDRNNWLLAKRVCAGFTSYEALQATWELIPWSWLSDWFSGTSTLLTAMNNTVGARPVECCLMQHTLSQVTWYGWDKPTWVTIKGYNTAVEERKVRMVVNPGLFYFPTVCMPCLTAGHWSILGSLAAYNLPNL